MRMASPRGSNKSPINPFPLNQGTLYVALVRLDQKGSIKGAWQRTESNRDAKVLRHHESGP